MAAAAPHKPLLSPEDEDAIQHCSRINGVLYDLRPFMRRHPGGSDLLMMAAGRDATILVASYHRRDVRFRAALTALPRLPQRLAAAATALIDRDSHSSKAAQYDVASELYTELKSRVNAHFGERSSRGGVGMVLKALALLSLTAYVYYCLVFLRMFALAPVLGFLMAVSGLAIQHDANHGALTRWPTVNAAFGFVDDMIGGSALCWRTQHNAGHHQHPNDVELDPDTYANWPLIRFNSALDRKWFHAFQWAYAHVMYMFIGVAYPIGDFTDFFRRRHEHVYMHQLRPRDVAQFVLGKALHYGLTLLLPMVLLGPLTGFLRVWLPMQLAGGYFLAASFAVSHNTEATLYNPRREAAAAGGKLPCWAAMQIACSADWSAESVAASHLWGGLNTQIAHHLFPGVCHVHYPEVSRVVREVCVERGIVCNDYPTFGAIWWAHLRQLWRLGRPGAEGAAGGVGVKQKGA